MVAYTEVLPIQNEEKLKSTFELSCYRQGYTKSKVIQAINHEKTLLITSQTSTKKNKPSRSHNSDYEECSLFVAFLTFLSYGVLLMVGYIKEFFFPPSSQEKNREGYVPLYIGFESFYTRNVYRRIQDCWAVPISSVPGSEVTVVDRYTPDYGWTMKLSGTYTKCINVGSYNYLGFAENKGTCYEQAAEVTSRLGLSTSSSRHELGNMKIHEELEGLMAEFLGVESVITFGMGFATNVLNLPSLLGPGCLVFSDEFNHASLILGLRLSGATTKVFKHNNCDDLEKKLRHALVHGQQRTRRPWRKVLIVVEGIYSMEGTICNLPRLIQIRNKYKTYLYVDEAHSIGAIGKHGGGVVDYYNCRPSDVDIHMGTFTKSFGAAGGYIAGSKVLIDHLRVNSHAHVYAASMSPPVAQQIIASLNVIMGRDNTDLGDHRIMRLDRNTKYFRRQLKQAGFVVFGNASSPVVPVLLYLPTVIAKFVRELTKRGVAGVGVGFPATKITGGRMRFCLSASHTKEMLDKILKEVNEVGDMCGAKHSFQPRNKEEIEW